MLHRTLGRVLAAAAVFCAPLMAGDYDHIFDVVKETWPERTLAMAICNKDANQFALIDLADTAKARGISLLIVDLREEKDYNKTMVNAMSRTPGFFLLIEEDAILGLKGHLTARMIYRVAGRDIPTVALSKDALKLGAVVAAGGAAGDPVYATKDVLKKMNLAIPAKSIDPGEGKAK